ncbi:MAG: thioesterase family protein [Bacteroidota bacterium]
MYQHTHQLRPRYGETDQMGFVYYGVYLSYYEVARVESLRYLGLSYKKLEEAGFWMPVLENHSKYHAPATYDELLTIKTTIPELPSSRVRFQYEIFGESEKLLHSGETLLCFLSKGNGCPCRPPKEILEALKGYF